MANRNQGLKLINNLGQSITLKAPRLEQLFAQAELSVGKHKQNQQTTPALSMQYLARSGLYTPQAVIDFLRSPEGLSTLAIMNEKLAEIAAIEDNMQHEQLVQFLKKKRMTAFLLLGLLHKKTAHAHRLNEQAYQEHEKKAHQKHKVEQSESAADPYQAAEMQATASDAAAYQKAATELRKALDDAIKIAKKLEQEQLQIEMQHLDLINKYATQAEHLDALHVEFDHEQVTTERLMEKMQALRNEIQKNNDRATHLSNKSDTPGIRALVDANIQRHLWINALTDILSVKRGEKNLYNKAFEAVTGFADADFILPKDLKLVKKDSKTYLIRSNQTLDSMGSEEKNIAEEQFKQLKPTDIMVVKKNLHYNFNLEKQAVDGRSDAIAAKSESMQQMLLLLQTQLLELQSILSNPELSLKPTKSTRPSLAKIAIPSNKPSPHQPPPNQQWVSDSYKQMLMLMRPNPTERSIAWLKSSIANPNNSPELRKQLNELRPGLPIPPATMNNLLKSNTLVSATLQLKTPLGLQKEATRTTPSPLSTNPFDQHRQ